MTVTVRVARASRNTDNVPLTESTPIVAGIYNLRTSDLCAAYECFSELFHSGGSIITFRWNSWGDDLVRGV